MTTITQTQTPAEKLQAILADAKDYGAALAQEQKLRRAVSSINAQIAAKRTELAKAHREAHTHAEKLVGVAGLIVGEHDAPPELEPGPSVTELEVERRELEDDLGRHRAAIPRQEKVVRKLGEPLAHKIAKELRPDLLRLKQRAIEACENLVSVSTEMADAYRALLDSGLGAAIVHSQIGPPNRATLGAWLREAKKDVSR